MNRFTKFVVNLSYSIEHSSKYQSFHKFLYNILENSTHKYKKFFDLFMIFLVLSTVFILVYEVKNDLPLWTQTYEEFAIVIFILEWIGRFIISFESHKQIIRDYEEAEFLNLEYKLLPSIKTIIKKKLSYVFSPLSIIDLLAILPSYRPLRILRIFLLFRLFKLLRYSNSLNQFLRVFVEKKYELFLLLAFYVLMIFFASTIFYIYETNTNSGVDSFFDAIYWGFITISTIGYGDISPHTEAGKVVVLLLIITGYTIIAFFTSIVTSTISEKLYSIKEKNTIVDIQKMKNFILVLGYGKVGETLVNQLRKQNYRVVVVEKDEELVNKAELNSIPIIKDDATKTELLRKIILNNNVLYSIVSAGQDAVNISIILSIRSISKKLQIIAVTNSIRLEKKLHIAGANKVLHINKAAVFEALGFLRYPIAYEAIDEILIDQKGALLEQIEVFKDSYLVNKAIKDINFYKYNVNFIGILRDNQFIFNPNKDSFILKAKDFIIIIGYEKSIAMLKNDIHTIRGLKWL